MKKAYIISLLIAVIPVVCLSQEGDPEDQDKKGGFGGPDQVENLLEEDKKEKQPFF